MDRDRESLRDEILKLDEASQAWLASEIEDNLSKSGHQHLWHEEVKRRDEEWESGRITGVNVADAIGRAREIVQSKRNGK